MTTARRPTPGMRRLQHARTPLWFLRGLTRGVVTTRYPRRPDPSAAELPSPPAFRPALISSALADELVEACPSGALSRVGAALRYDVGACTSCGRCALVGGDAVEPSAVIELAARRRSDLVKEIPLLGEDRR